MTHRVKPEQKCPSMCTDTYILSTDAPIQHVEFTVSVPLITSTSTHLEYFHRGVASWSSIGILLRINVCPRSPHGGAVALETFELFGRSVINMSGISILF